MIMQLFKKYQQPILYLFFGVCTTAVFVDCMGMNDLLIKIASNVLVVILNYVASKLIIFRKKG